MMRGGSLNTLKQESLVVTRLHRRERVKTSRLEVGDELAPLDSQVIN